MEQDEEQLSISMGVYVFLAAWAFTILVRTGTVRMPDALDFVMAILFGTVTLGVAKVLAYLIGDVLYDVLDRPGKAKATTPPAANQNMRLANVDTSTPSITDTRARLDGGFLEVGTKMVRLTREQQEELARYMHQANSGNVSASGMSDALHSKLSSVGLVSDGTLKRINTELLYVE